MIVAVPAETPVMVAVFPVPVEPAVAMPVLLLVHMPPVVRSIHGLVLPVHTLDVPVMTPGGDVTVTVVVT